MKSKTKDIFAWMNNNSYLLYGRGIVSNDGRYLFDSGDEFKEVESKVESYHKFGDVLNAIGNGLNNNDIYRRVGFIFLRHDRNKIVHRFDTIETTPKKMLMYFWRDDLAYMELLLDYCAIDISFKDGYPLDLKFLA